MKYNPILCFSPQDVSRVTGPVDESAEQTTCVAQWRQEQDGQRLLLTTPSILVGYRVQVYRPEGTTQWYTAVIHSYCEKTNVSKIGCSLGAYLSSWWPQP